MAGERNTIDYLLQMSFTSTGASLPEIVKSNQNYFWGQPLPDLSPVRDDTISEVRRC